MNEKQLHRDFGYLLYEYLIVICALLCFGMLGLSKKTDKITKEKGSDLVKKWHSIISNHLGQQHPPRES